MTDQTKTCFGLIRHAPTLWNEKKIIQGQLDSSLSPAGKKQAASWGKELHGLAWDRILCSDLGRARETAGLINETLRLPLTSVPEFREQDWGRWSGLNLASIRAKQLQFLEQQVQAGWEFRPPGGESRREVLNRCLTALIQAQEAYPGELVLVVCHEGVIKCLLNYLLGRSFLPTEPSVIKNFHLHLLAVQKGIPYVERINRLALAGAEKLTHGPSQE